MFVAIRKSLPDRTEQRAKHSDSTPLAEEETMLPEMLAEMILTLTVPDMPPVCQIL